MVTEVVNRWSINDPRMSHNHQRSSSMSMGSYVSDERPMTRFAFALLIVESNSGKCWLHRYLRTSGVYRWGSRFGKHQWRGEHHSRARWKVAYSRRDGGSFLGILLNIEKYRDSQNKWMLNQWRDGTMTSMKSEERWWQRHTLSQVSCDNLQRTESENSSTAGNEEVDEQLTRD